ncbi:hypothetical protein CNR22_20960 [Sphingobacteriaceae bacterium]|nr:hypothetical protein CNR22_20960 [Sphingobacteriaceae bacterium]
MSTIKIENMISDARHFEGYSLCRRPDDIIEIRFNEGFTIGLNDAKNIVAVIQALKTTEKCLFLVLFEEDNSFDLETREYISSDEVSKIIKADAFVIKGLAMEILGRGYLNINKPGRPTRLFKSAAAGAIWLLNYLD